MIRRKVKRPQRWHHRGRRVRAVARHIRCMRAAANSHTRASLSQPLSSSCADLCTHNERYRARIREKERERKGKNRWHDAGGGVEAPGVWGKAGEGGKKRARLEVGGGQWPLRHREPIVEEEPSVVEWMPISITRIPRRRRGNRVTLSRYHQGPPRGVKIIRL